MKLLEDAFDWYKIYTERCNAGQVKGIYLKSWWLYNNRLSETQCFLMWLQSELAKIKRRSK